MTEAQPAVVEVNFKNNNLKGFTDLGKLCRMFDVFGP